MPADSVNPSLHPDLWTIEALLGWTQRFFSEKGIPSARLDAELLLAHALKLSRLELYLQKDRPLDEAERAPFRQLVRQRASGWPAAYLLGEQEFWSLPLEVSPAVLIPRPDTETLVEQAVTRIRKWQHGAPGVRCRIAELGTGSGAIPLALASELQDLDLISAELSPDAHALAERNRERHAALGSPRNNTLTFLRGDALTLLPEHGPFHFWVANPPYIARDVLPTLQPEVAQHEPRLALDGGEDGLDLYRRLLAEVPSCLAPGGEMLLEIGNDQQPALTQLAADHPAWQPPVFHKDLAGQPRVVHLFLW